MKQVKGSACAVSQVCLLLFVFLLCSQCSDGKEYDVYVSYARNAEEEEFVLLTLRGVLENEFGYKLCIFDRDSLPGGSEYFTGGCAPCASSLYCSLRY